MGAHQPESVTLGLIQMRCQEAPEANLETATARIQQAAGKGAEIICLQELFRSQYFCQRQDPAIFNLAEPIPGPTTERLSAVAREVGAVLIASLFERRTAGVYHNTAVVFDADGTLLGLYRKMHIPDDPLYYEKYYFTPGDLGFRAFSTRFGRIGVLVCWDQWYPEGARLTALQGASILFYPTAIGWHPREKAEFGTAQYQAWELIQRSHALANGVYVAAVNRVGYENPASPGPFLPSPLMGEGPGVRAEAGLEFWGGSFISDPFGSVIARASHDQEELLIGRCDLQRIEEIRRNWPFLRDRRIDAYGDLARRWIG
jgi:N-carbamoylputrescine amidase